MTSLTGRRIFLGRDAERAAPLVQLLTDADATVVCAPLVQISFQVDTSELDHGLLSAQSGDIDWLAFTSVNAVRAVVRRAGELALPTVPPASIRIAAVGPATAHELHTHGFPVDLMPSTAGSGRTLGAAFPTAPMSGATVLMPQAESPSPDLGIALRAKGYQLRPALAYRTVRADVPSAIAEELRRGAFDAAILTSPSALAAFLPAVHPATALVAIGEPTAEALRRHAIEPAAVAADPTPDGLMAALEKALH